MSGLSTLQRFHWQAQPRHSSDLGRSPSPITVIRRKGRASAEHRTYILFNGPQWPFIGEIK